MPTPTLIEYEHRSIEELEQEIRELSTMLFWLKQALAHKQAQQQHEYYQGNSSTGHEPIEKYFDKSYC